MIVTKSIERTQVLSMASMNEWLIVSSGFSCLLLAGRMLATGSFEYIFLPWNLLLAFIPYWITRWMTKNIGVITHRIKLFIILTVWLLFIPNSFYIITDLFHFTEIHSAPAWFDLLLIFSFAWNGIACGIISIRKIEILLKSLLQRKNISFILIFTVMWLNAFGVYIGRYLRFNSWDVITNPFALARDIFNMIIHPFQNMYPWGMTISYSIFMTLLYFTIKKMSDSFAK
jgi:uncharacterized membrane protein